MSAPLVVNTVDGTVWLRRAATRGGLALYAPQDVCRCPEFVMATEAELAEHGITGSADVLPVPVGPDWEAAHEARRDRYAKALYEFVNGAFMWEASDDQDSWRAEADAAIAVADDELVGVNLSLYEEELENSRLRLALASAKRGRSKLRARVAELEAQRERRRVRLVALQNDALNMRGTLSPNGEQRKVPMPLGETLTPAVEWLVNRVAELLAERHSTNEALDDAVQALRTDRAEPAEGPSAAESADRLTAFFAPVASLREDPVAEPVSPRVQAMRALLDGQRAAVEDPHDGPLHRDWRLGRDLPETGGAR